MRKQSACMPSKQIQGFIFWFTGDGFFWCGRRVRLEVILRRFISDVYVTFLRGFG